MQFVKNDISFSTSACQAVFGVCVVCVFFVFFFKEVKYNVCVTLLRVWAVKYIC